MEVLHNNDMRIKDKTIVHHVYMIYEMVSSSELSYVYIGRHTETEEDFIIKEFFPKELVLRDLDDKTVLCRYSSFKTKFNQLMESFLNEAHILQQLSDPNIVKYIEHFEENGTAYLVMEYCKGITLDSYIKQEKTILEPHFFKKTLFPLLETLEYIHHQGVIHRDIKPGNIIILEDGQPKLLDFGSATEYEKNAGHLIFTTAGFSPIEFYSSRAQLGIYSDIYSLAATLYYCLSGTAPLDVSTRLIEDKIKPIRRYNKGITPWFARMIMKSLSVDYKKRYSSLKNMKTMIKIESIFLNIKGRWWLRRREA